MCTGICFVHAHTLACVCCLQIINRYRAFRRASDMRSNLYVTCCKMCILGRVEAISGFSRGDFGSIRLCPGAILGIIGAILGQLWEVLGVFGSSLGRLGATLGGLGGLWLKLGAKGSGFGV